MQRKPIITLVVLSIFLALSTWVPAATTVAKDDRVVLVRAFDESRERKDSNVGDSCGIYLDPSRFVFTKQQIVIRDEADTIIAIADLEGSLEEGILPRELQCAIRLEIPVPEAKFYTAYLGDRRITSFSASKLPLDAIWLSFD